MSYLERLIETFKKGNYINAEYSIFEKVSIKLPGIRKPVSCDMPRIIGNRKICLKDTDEKSIFLLRGEGDDHFPLIIKKKIDGINHETILSILKTPEKENQLAELFNLVKLNEINPIICYEYMKDVYGEEENFPLRIVKPEFVYSFNSFFGKNKYTFLYQSQFKNIEDMNLNKLEISALFGKKIVGFNENFAHDNLLIYENGPLKISLNIDERYITRGIKFRKKMHSLLKHIEICNNKMKEHKDPIEAYMAYLGEIMSPPKSKKL